jgi:group I intron endonuclease
MLTNLINNKKYIGVTNNFKKRMREHKSSKNNCVISRAIRKYGWDNFKSEIIEQTTDKEYAYGTLEQIYIKLYETFDFGYNSTLGGEGSPGYNLSEETRNKMSLAKLGKKLSSEHSMKISESNKGRIVSKETREKIGEKLKNNKHFSGKTFTKETINILSEKKAKDYIFISPQGEIVEIHNMRKFCFDNNLFPSAMCKVYSGQQKHHKKWTKYHSISNAP